MKAVVGFGPSIAKDAKQRITSAVRLFFERGLADYYDRNPQGILRLPFPQQVNWQLANLIN